MFSPQAEGKEPPAPRRSLRGDGRGAGPGPLLEPSEGSWALGPPHHRALLKSRGKGEEQGRKIKKIIIKTKIPTTPRSRVGARHPPTPYSQDGGGRRRCAGEGGSRPSRPHGGAAVNAARASGAPLPCDKGERGTQRPPCAPSPSLPAPRRRGGRRRRRRLPFPLPPGSAAPRLR